METPWQFCGMIIVVVTGAVLGGLRYLGSKLVRWLLGKDKV